MADGCEGRGLEGRESDWFNNGPWHRGSTENGKHVCGERQNALARLSRRVGGDKQEGKKNTHTHTLVN